MDEIKKFCDKQQTLFVFLKGITMRKTICSQGNKDSYRKEYDAYMNKARILTLNCVVSEIDLENEIADNAGNGKRIIDQIKGYCTYLDIDSKKHPIEKRPYFKSLYENGIINGTDIAITEAVIYELNEVMKNNVLIIEKLLIKWCGAHPKDATQQANNGSPILTQINQQQKNEANPSLENGNSITADDLLLRIFFGEHLTDFLKEAQTRKNGTEVARLVNWYIDKYNLDTGRMYRKKPLHDALLEKGVIKIKQSAWNNAIK